MARDVTRCYPLLNRLHLSDISLMRVHTTATFSAYRDRKPVVAKCSYNSDSSKHIEDEYVVLSYLAAIDFPIERYAPALSHHNPFSGVYTTTLKPFIEGSEPPLDDILPTTAGRKYLEESIELFHDAGVAGIGLMPNDFRLTSHGLPVILDFGQSVLRYHDPVLFESHKEEDHDFLKMWTERAHMTYRYRFVSPG